MFKQIFTFIFSVLFFIEFANAEVGNFIDTQPSEDTSQLTIWNNVMYNTTGYNEFNSVALSLSFAGNSLLLGNSNLPGIPGFRHVWQLNGNNWTNLSNTWLNYQRSAPTTLLPLSTSEVIVGHFNGAVQDCSNICHNLIPSQENLGLGVTSILHLNHNYFVAYSDVNLGNNGKLLVYQETPPNNTPQQFNVIGIDSGVGKLATDDNYIYAPTKANGVLKISLDGLNTTTITPITLENKEFITVLYYAKINNTLYAGTSFANVYRVELPINKGNNWVKLTNKALSKKAYISDIAVNNLNDLYVGLGNLFGPIEDGSLYLLKNSTSNFIKALGYSDTSSITSILFNNNHIFVATFAGNIWQN